MKRQPIRAGRRRQIGAAVALVLAAGAVGCAHVTPDRSIASSVSPAPAIPWVPAADAKSPQESYQKKLEIPQEYLVPGTTLTLPQLVDVALRNNPQTREAWHFARAAAAQVGSKRAEYFPVIELDGSVTREKAVAPDGQSTFLQTSYGPGGLFTWLRHVTPAGEDLRAAGRFGRFLRHGCSGNQQQSEHEEHAHAARVNSGM